MLKRLMAVCVAMSLLLSGLSAPAFAQLVLWAATNDCTCLVKDEEYVAVPALMMAVPGVEVATSPLIEETDGGLVILYEEPVPEELAGVEDTVQPEPNSVEEEVPPELVDVEEEPEAELEEIELEENTNGDIQEP